MRNLLAIVAAATLGAGVWQTASAADLPIKAPPAAVVAPVSLWTGCYLGGNLGGSWGSGNITVTGAGGSASRSGSNSGFAGGGQIGCDYQMGAVVLGVRNMFDWSNRETTSVIQTGALAGNGATLKNNWIDLLTGRLGYAVSPQWLLYFQGGAAWRQSSLQLFTPGGAQVLKSDTTRTGWTIGGGAEWRFAPNWSVFLEYDHADFGTRSASFNTVAFGPVTASAKSNADLLLVGVNWRPNFGF
jgi:outer membrane immunogenic protein